MSINRWLKFADFEECVVFEKEDLINCLIIMLLYQNLFVTLGTS